MNDRNPELLKEINAIVSQCDRCGSCHLVCPTFGVNSKEVCGARGKVNAARALARGGVASEVAISETVDYCLLCGACKDVCASKVNVPVAMRKVRQYLAPISQKQLGLTEEEEATYEQAFTTLCDASADLPSAQNAGEQKVAYFFGCTARLSSPATALQTVKLLKTLGPVELCNNSCCGLPALTRGNMDKYLETTKQNIAIYEDVDVVVCDCAGCGDTLKNAASYLACDPEWADRAQKFSRKIVSLSEYLAKTGYIPQIKTGEKITYHEACRLGRGQGVKKAPRDLLKTSGNYVEMAGADVCCGGSCFFPTDYPETSEALLEKKCANIEKSGAAVVTTECHRCLAQLKKAAEKSGGKFRAVHISEVI